MSKKSDNIISMGHFEINIDKQTFDFDHKCLAVLPTFDFVMFPGLTFPISLGRESSLKLARKAEDAGFCLGIFCQKDSQNETPDIPEGIYDVGVVAKVAKVIDIPDGPTTAILISGPKVKITGPGTKPGTVYVETLPALSFDEEDQITQVLTSTLSDLARQLIRKASDMPEEMLAGLTDTSNPVQMVNNLASQLPFDIGTKLELLRQNSFEGFGMALLKALNEQKIYAELRHDIEEQTQARLKEGQREVFLHNQLETIREQLYGDTNDDADQFMQLLENAALPDEIRERLTKEIQKLQRYSPQSPDYSVQYSYLDTVLNLPWGVYSPQGPEFNEAESLLEHSHYGLKKIKERIVEQLATILNAPEGHAPILCLVGPPGVGKTSLGRSIADALGRKYQRIALGGVSDESEIRGHRRTYIGAMPGRIIDAIRRTGTCNPLLLLDEVDKLGNNGRSQPDSALLEVLDPEQNRRFHDNYIDVDFDLSHVLFISTANTTQSIPAPLRDRMEIIELSGYLREEKIEIARRHLAPRILKANGLKPTALKFSDEALGLIIDQYTSESGVRNLEKMMSKIVRQSLVRKFKQGRMLRDIKPAHVTQMLGLAPFQHDIYEGNSFAGVVTGLAWTSVGGEILYVETSLSPSKTPTLSLTGNLGDVMKESARIALEYVKAHTDIIGIDPRIFDSYSIHIHVPEGAIPKDGPSAGITMVTSLVSALTQKKVAHGIAMTGEITLRGKVMPVGGIKEKILAAKRAGIHTIILSERNRRNIDDMEQQYTEGMTFVYVDTAMDVIKHAITNDLIESPRNFEEYFQKSTIK